VEKAEEAKEAEEAEEEIIYFHLLLWANNNT
jgi:hypothetical protein